MKSAKLRVECSGYGKHVPLRLAILVDNRGPVLSTAEGVQRWRRLLNAASAGGPQQDDSLDSAQAFVDRLHASVGICQEIRSWHLAKTGPERRVHREDPWAVVVGPSGRSFRFGCRKCGVPVEPVVLTEQQVEAIFDGRPDDLRVVYDVRPEAPISC